MHPIDLSMYELVAADEISRAARISARWRAYHGQYPKLLKIRAGQPDDNVAINFARVIVDKGVSFLFGQDVNFELDEVIETDAERWLEQCWKFNRKMTLLQKLAFNGAISGHVFVKILPTKPFPRLILLAPETVSVMWEPDDIDRITSIKIQYPAIDHISKKPIVVRQLIERQGSSWRILDQRGTTDRSSWQTISDVEWPYAWPPIVECQNLPCPNEFWGISDLEDDVLHLISSINFVVSNLVRIIRYHAHPKTWGRGFSSNQLSTAIDETIVFPSPDAELRNLEMQSDLSSSLLLYQRLRESLHEISRIPEVATGKLENIGALSGVALHILYQPLIEKTEMKRRTYGDMLIELNRRLLELGGFGDSNFTTIHWPELIPGDPESEAKTLVLWQQLGVSQDTLLRRLGLNPDIERQKQNVTTTDLGDRLLNAFERGHA